MISAFDEILTVRNRSSKITDLRTAAYVSAIQKVGTSYLELGIGRVILGTVAKEDPLLVAEASRPEHEGFFWRFDGPTWLVAIGV